MPEFDRVVTVCWHAGRDIVWSFPFATPPAGQAVWFAEDNGWKDKEYAKKLQLKIEKVGNFCDIVKLKGQVIDTYVKKGRYGGGL